MRALQHGNEALPQLRDAGIEVGAQRVPALDEAEAGLERARQQGGRGGGEDVAARFLQQPFDEDFAAGDEGPGGACRLPSVAM